MACAVLALACAEVKEGPTETGPIEIPPGPKARYCISEATLISDLLASSGSYTSCISEDSCDREIDTGDEGYFETWHLYADETATVVIDLNSEFDSLMLLGEIIEAGDDVSTKVIAVNDDRSAEDPRALIAATFEAAQDYLLRVSSFNDEESGCYTIQTIQVGPGEEPPAPPEVGSLRVRVDSTGAAPATYTVTLNGAKAKAICGRSTS